MKKIFLLLCMAALILGACGGQEIAETEDTYAPIEVPAQEEVADAQPPAQEDDAIPKNNVESKEAPDVEVEEYAAQEEETEGIGLSPDEIRELLEGIPYAGMWGPGLVGFGQPVVNSETARELGSFIYWMNGVELPRISASFHSPEEANADFLFSRAHSATKLVQWVDPDWDNYHPELRAIQMLSNSPHMITLHSHIEQTARKLFGLDLEISRPQDLPFMVRYQDLFGIAVYYSHGWGPGPVDLWPIILSYEYTDGSYEVICVFVWWFDGYFFYSPPNSDEDEGISEYEAVEWLHTLPRHTITLKRNQHGGFYYWAHILPE